MFASPTLEVSTLGTLDPHSLISTTNGRQLYLPQITHCPYCVSALKFYKTTEPRTVYTLTGPRVIQEKILVCPNEACNYRTDHTKNPQSRAYLTHNSAIDILVWPYYQFGLDVVIQVGQLRWQQRWSGERIHQELFTHYQLEIDLSTVYRYIDLYEALCKGSLSEHSAEIRQRLQSQLVVIYLVDATQLANRTKLYRLIDYLSGYCLGTLLVPEGTSTDIEPWLTELYHTYGPPAYLVSDGESTLHTQLAEFPPIPHADCWWHVLQNVRDALFTVWRKEAQQLLQTHAYRSRINKIRQQLPVGDTKGVQDYAQAIRTLLDLFLLKPSASQTFDEPLAILLKHFKDALTLLNKWERILQGQKNDFLPEVSTFDTYRTIKQNASPKIQREWLQQSWFTTDPYYQAFRQLHTLLHDLCHDTRYNHLCAQYNQLHNEFLTLKSWLDEADVRRWQEFVQTQSTLIDQVPPELFERITVNLRKKQQELASLPKKLVAWHWHGSEPPISLPQKARSLLTRIIERWTKKARQCPPLGKAVAILTRQYEELLVFLEFPLIPLSNQAIETDHGQLKQLWRQCSGGEDRPYTLDYHGEGSSLAHNFPNTPFHSSSLMKLGFTIDEVTHWLITCPFPKVKASLTSLQRAREPRRQLLRIRRSGLLVELDWTLTAWLTWALRQISPNSQIRLDNGG